MFIQLIDISGYWPWYFKCWFECHAGVSVKKNDTEMYLFKVYLIHPDFTIYFSNRSNFLFSVCVSSGHKDIHTHGILIRSEWRQDTTKPNKAKISTKIKPCKEL